MILLLEKDFTNMLRDRKFSQVSVHELASDAIRKLRAPNESAMNIVSRYFMSNQSVAP